MLDQISITRINMLHPAIKHEVFELYQHAQINLPAEKTLRITQTFRNIAEQNKLYAQGRTTRGDIVTNAKGGSSYHNYGLAIDFRFIINKQADYTINEDWLKVVKIFKDAGYSWGGDWKGKLKDYPHFEKSFSYSVKELLVLNNGKKFIEGTNYVKLENKCGNIV